MGCTIGVLGFDSWRRLGIFLFSTASRTALGPTQPPIQWVPRIRSLRVKRPEYEADNSSPTNAEVKEWVGLYLHSPNTPSWRGAQLKYTQRQLYILCTMLKTQIRVQVNGAGCIAADCFSLSIWSRYRDPSELMPSFSLYWWDTCWLFVVAHPLWDKVKGRDKFVPVLN
jgi:hypothetical protein